jgi:hypothetical protein
VLLTMSLWLSPASADPGWTPYVSEEGSSPWALCDASTDAAFGFDCSGGFCDNVSLWCDSLPDDLTIVRYHASSWFSEEGDNLRECIAPGPASWWSGSPPTDRWSGVVTGIRCSGSNCDNLSIECGKAVSVSTSETAVLYDCDFWAISLSEESPPMDFGDRVITGARCDGSYCDNVLLTVCGLVSPVHSCEEGCGGQAPGGCWCDAACATFGDCCEDEYYQCHG